MAQSRRRRVHRPNREGRSRWYYLLRGILTSLLVTVPVFLILSAAMSMTVFPEEYVSPALLATVIVSIVLAAFLATVGARNSGWFNGSLVGLLYTVLMMLVRWTLERRVVFDVDTATMLLAGILLGSISGMVGLHLTGRLQKDRRRRS